MKYTARYGYTDEVCKYTVSIPWRYICTSEYSTPTVTSTSYIYICIPTRYNYTYQVQVHLTYTPTRYINYEVHP